ncbi:MAG: phospho-N-acetylmuramoyl-pentapeptide-transferase, partial [Erysipelotrichaceae bacterium]
MYIFITAAASFTLTFLLIPKFIPFLRKIKFGQAIRTEGPESHLKKQGTPVMGGIIFILVPLFVFAIMGNMFFDDWRIQTILISYVGFGLIGFIDDYLVVIKKSNNGLSAKCKFLLQSFLAIILITIAWQHLEPLVTIPFTSYEVNIGFLYPIICFVMFTATSNGVNLSDGLDGLCAGLCIIAFVGFTIICYRIGYYQVALFLVAVIFSLLAYLWYNKAPARIFMGDV